MQQHYSANTKTGINTAFLAPQKAKSQISNDGENEHASLELTNFSSYVRMRILLTQNPTFHLTPMSKVLYIGMTYKEMAYKRRGH